MDGAPLAAARACYDDDLYAWALEQAELLRAGRLSEADLDNLAEELETLAKRQRRALISRLRLLIHHLLKWEVQPESRSRSWKWTISEQRRQIEERLEDNPSLAARWDELFAAAYEPAIKAAGDETGIPRSRFRLVSMWSRDQILSQDFFPGEQIDDLPR